jgi:hypothetical protein
VERRTAYLVAGGAALGLGAWWLANQYELGGVAGEASQLLNDALNAIVKGDRLTHAPYDKTTGVVPGRPEDLAEAAGLDVETYSLARMIASEEGRSNNRIKAAVAWAIKNKADSLGRTITDHLTRTVEPSHHGQYGTYILLDKSSASYREDKNGKPNRGDRDASTANDPYDGDAQIAAAVRSGQIADLTGGATQFDRPDGERDPDAVAAKRLEAGQVLADVPGIDPDVDGIRFWRAA